MGLIDVLLELSRSQTCETHYIEGSFNLNCPPSTPQDSELAEARQLIPEAPAALPTDWLRDLHRATIEGDLGWMLSIAQIRQRDEAIANALAVLADRLQFEQLLALMQQALNET